MFTLLPVKTSRPSFLNQTCMMSFIHVHSAVTVVAMEMVTVRCTITLSSLNSFPRVCFEFHTILFFSSDNTNILPPFRIWLLVMPLLNISILLSLLLWKYRQIYFLLFQLFFLFQFIQIISTNSSLS